MQSANFDSSDAPRVRVTTVSRAAEWAEVFHKVTDCYVTLRSFPPLAARNYDQQSNRRAASWSPEIAGFLMDVERVTEEALGENIALQAAWFSLAAGETVPTKARNAVYRLCGTLYKSRGLSPSRYFRRSLKNDGWMTADGDA